MNYNMELAAHLLDWHGGGGSGLYAVGSCLYSGHEPDIEQVRRAIHELRNLKAEANYPECVTKEDEDTCNRLADELERMYKEASE